MTIKDEILTPFYIKVENGTYELRKARKTGLESKEPGKEYDQNIGYFTSLTACLSRAAVLLLEEADGPRAYSLREYTERIGKIFEELKVNFLNRP
jgi:hypothetical protein